MFQLSLIGPIKILANLKPVIRLEDNSRISNYKEKLEIELKSIENPVLTKYVKGIIELTYDDFKNLYLNPEGSFIVKETYQLPEGFYLIKKFKKVPGIYYFKCDANNKDYLGGKLDLHNRLFYNQKTNPFKDSGKSRHIKFYNSVNKYGWKSFSLSIMAIINNHIILFQLINPSMKLNNKEKKYYLYINTCL